MKNVQVGLIHIHDGDRLELVTPDKLEVGEAVAFEGTFYCPTAARVTEYLGQAAGSAHHRYFVEEVRS